MAISVVVLGVVGLLEDQLSRVAGFINQELQNQQGLEQVFDVLVTEVRSMGPSSIGGYAIQAAASSSFIFFSDVDQDGIFERVRYTLTSTTLERGLIEPTGNPLQYVTSSETVRTLVTNILAASSTFLYFDENYTGAENPLPAPIDLPSIRVVRIDVYADVSPSTAPQPTYFTNTVAIRNLRGD